MERSSRVLQHGNTKIFDSFFKILKLNFDLYFNLCQRAEIIQVGLNIHLYDDCKIVFNIRCLPLYNFGNIKI